MAWRNLFIYLIRTCADALKAFVPQTKLPR